MADGSKIEWTEATWNPLRGCSRVSEGCRHCYAEGIAARFAGPGEAYAGLASIVARPDGSKEPRWSGDVRVVEEHLLDPLRWKRPRRIFVNSMSDLFHEKVPDTDIATIYGVAIASVHLNGHVLQILTKRGDRMREILASKDFWDQVNAEAKMHVMERVDPLARRSDDARATLDDYGPDNPPPGIWLGVSAEDQATADERIPLLLETPAAVRFVSLEPLLGPIDLRPNNGIVGVHHHPDNLLETPEAKRAMSNLIRAAAATMGARQLDWVIVGGESGPRARPMHPDWARSLRDQCTAAGVPFFFKQWGEHRPLAPVLDPSDDYVDAIMNADERRSEIVDGQGHIWRDEDGQPPNDSWMVERVGKKAAGRELDGRTWEEFPA